jgi:hypothetical protein
MGVMQAPHGGLPYSSSAAEATRAPFTRHGDDTLQPCGAGGYLAAMPRLLPLSLLAALTLAAAAPAAAGVGATTPLCFGVPATRVGSAKADVINGTWGPDVIVGLGGNDTIDGKGGDDLICGGSGADLVKGGPGRDRLRGDGGADTVIGGDQGDRAIGGAGADACDAERELTCEAEPSPPNPGDARDCGDFATQAEAQAWFDTYYLLYGDVAHLDYDNDREACETLP